MVPIPVPPILVPAAFVVGTHGFTDMVTHPRMIPAYAFAIPPWPLTTTVFTLASVAHFSEDVGIQKSLFLHASILSVARTSLSLAATTLLTYMCTVHVPRHVSRVNHAVGEIPGLGLLMCASLIIGCLLPLPYISDSFQRVACIHIAIHLLRPLS